MGWSTALLGCTGIASLMGRSTALMSALELPASRHGPLPSVCTVIAGLSFVSTAVPADSSFCCSCRFINHWYLHCTRYHGHVRGSDLVTVPLSYSTFFYQRYIPSGSPLLLDGTGYPLMVIAIVSYATLSPTLNSLCGPLLASIDVVSLFSTVFLVFGLMSSTYQ